TSVLLLVLISVPAIAAKHRSRSAAPLSIDAVNGAEIDNSSTRPSGAALLRAQILLDRAHFSPGEIDDNFGENTRKAVRIYREMKQMGSGDRIDEAFLRPLVDGDVEPVLMISLVTKQDTAGPSRERSPRIFGKWRR